MPELQTKWKNEINQKQAQENAFPNLTQGLNYNRRQLHQMLSNIDETPTEAEIAGDGCEVISEFSLTEAPLRGKSGGATVG